MLEKNETPTLVLNRVRATLFREGVRSAAIQATRITANQRERILVGTGGVTVTSLTTPPDAIVTADKVTWNSRDNRITAVGHAHLIRRPAGGGMPFEHRGGRITFPADLKGDFLIE